MTGAELQAAEFVQILHLKLGRGGYGYNYACALDRRVEVHIRRPSAREAARTTLHVGEQVFERGQWDAAARALNALSEGDRAA